LNLKTKEEILPCQIMMVGDSLSSDMAGGIGVGMKTCFYNPDLKPIPRDMQIDYCVSSLDEIKNIL
jgi:2-haloacid dehalogenase